MAHLEVWDIIAIVVYFMLVVAAGIYSFAYQFGIANDTCKVRGLTLVRIVNGKADSALDQNAMFKANRGTVAGYFLAGRDMTWITVGASLFASNIGSEHFIGLAGSGAAGGIGVGSFELSAALILVLLGWIFLPVLIASKVSTLPEYMSKRFGGQRIRIFLSVLSLVLYIFTKISVNLYSGALFIRLALGWNLYISTVLLLAMTALCTITGGLAAVIYTDTLQCFVMILGAAVLMIKAFIEVGGFESLVVRYMDAIPLISSNNTCGHPREDSWMMFRNAVDSDIPWPGFVFGQVFASIWYWCTDQMMVQRALAAKSLSHAQGGTIFTGCLKMLPVFLIVLPGMISRVLYTDIIACVDPDECYKHCESRVSCSNLAYPLLILKLLPPGLRGILMAVMLAALMSDLTSVFNSASTLFTIDIWQRVRRSAKTKELLLVGKVFVVFMVGASIAWIPIILQMQGGQLFLYIQAISAYLAPPIASVYLLAIFWTKINEKGAFWGLMAGFLAGTIRMILDFCYVEPPCGEVDTRPSVLAKVHYMYFAAMLFCITATVATIVSSFTEATDSYRLIRTLFWTRFDSTVRPDEELNNGTTKSPGDTLPSANGNIGISMETIGNSSAVLTPSKSPEHLAKRFINFLCGYSSTEASDQQLQAMQDHLQKISQLNQSSKAKKFLLCGVIAVLVIETGLIIFFTAGTTAMLHSLRP